MINLIWCVIIIVSLFYSIITGTTNEVLNSLYKGIETAINLSLSLLGVMSFWSGISRICENNGITNFLSKALSPLLKFLFPKSYKDKEIKNLITVNFISNILGLSNAATPNGIKAVKKMNESKNSSIHEIILFTVINTCSLQLIPTSISALRLNMGSSEPFSIITSVWIVSFCTLVLSISLCKICASISKRKEKELG